MKSQEEGKTKKEENMNTVETQERMSIPEYSLERGIQVAAERIADALVRLGRPVIVEIAGGSASGKTSAVAAKLKERFGDDALIISMDDYYRGRTFMETEAKKGIALNWDQPEALNLELLKTHLSRIKNREAIEKPVYSFKTSEVAGSEEMAPRNVMLVEGLFALNDTVKREGDIKVFVDIGAHGRILRRLLRDVERTGQKPADILKYFAEVVEPMHEQHVQSTKKNADFVIKNEYSPRVEAGRSGLHEVQVKFRADVDEDALRKIGAERLTSSTQTDRYYNARDRNLVETEEILRIRDEGKHRILTYKGPKIGSRYRRRPKFEFEIDANTEQKFLSICGERLKTIEKERTLYRLGNTIFSVDTVAKIENGQRTALGTFIEIRSPDPEESGETMAALEELELRIEDGIRESYFEM